MSILGATLFGGSHNESFSILELTLGLLFLETTMSAGNAQDADAYIRLLLVNGKQ